MINLNDLFAGIGARAAQGVNPWATLAPSAPSGGDPFNSLQQSGPSQNDPWSALGGSGSNASGYDPWASLQGSAPVGKALSMLSAANNKINPTPNGGQWQANMTNTALTPEQQTWWDKAKSVGQAHGLDGDIFARQLMEESMGYNPQVISGAISSPKGAKGIAQFMDDTARAYHVNSLDPDQSIDGAARMMSDLLKAPDVNGDYQRALIKYNGGGGALQKWDQGQPYQESKDYVSRILSSAPQPAGTVAAQSGMNSDIMTRVQPFLGKAYVWGGKSPDTGFDCSGLAGWLAGTGTAESTKTLYAKSQAVDPSQAQPGDLVFYNMQGGNNPAMDEQHVATYIGNGQIVQAGGTAHNVNIASANQFTAPGWAPEFRRIAQ